MLLIGVNRSPYTRRVAVTLKAYGLPFEQRDLSGFGNRAEVRAANPLGRIPALVLDDGETLVDSAAIIDHLDEVVGRERALTPPAGADRRAVLRVAALMMGACDKGLHAAYERNHHPPEKVHQPWIDDCMTQMKTGAGRRRRDGRSGGSPTCCWAASPRPTSPPSSPSAWRAASRSTRTAEMPRLHAHCRRLLEQEAFRSTEP